MSGPPPVVIEYLAKGVSEVLRAHKSIGDALSKSDTRAAAGAKGRATEQQKAAEKSARDQIAAFRRADAMVDAARRVGLRKAEAQFKVEAAAAKKAAAEKISLANKVASARSQAEQQAHQRSQAIRDKSAAMAGALARRQASSESRISSQLQVERNRAVFDVRRGAIPNEARARIAMLDAAKGKPVEDQQAILSKVRLSRQEALIDKRIEDDKTREAERGERARRGIRERSASMSGRFAAKQARDEARQREEEERKAARRREQFGRAVYGSGARAFTAATSIGAAAARGLLDVGGGYSVADSVQRRVQLRGTLADISNRAIINGDPENEKRVSVDSLQSQVSSVGQQWAIDPSQAAAGLDKFAAKTGHLARGRQLLSGLAEMSRAGAGDLADLSDAAGDVFNADKTQSAEQVLAVMRAIAAQGKLGAVEMKDLASQMSKLGAAASQFQGDSGKNLAMLGGLAQMARESGGAAGPQQATTAIQSLAAQLNKNARVGGFKDLGVDVKDDRGFNRPIDQLLIEGMRGAEKRSRAGGHNMRDFDVIFGSAIYDQQARRAVTPLTKAYKEAGGGEAGEKAVRALFDKFGGATMSKEEVATAARERMKEADVALEQAMQKLRSTTADSLTPSLIRMTGVVEQLVPYLARFLNGVVSVADWSSKNPFGGFAALVTGFFLAELGKAQIASTIQKVIAGATPGGGAPGGVGAGAASLIALGAANQVGGLATLADERKGAVDSGRAAALKMAGDLNAGGERAQAARDQLAAAQSKASGVNVAAAYADTAMSGINTVLNPLGFAGQKAGDWAAEKAGVKSGSQMSNETLKADAIVEAMDRLRRSLDENNKATKQNTSTSAGGMSAKPQPIQGPIGRRNGG